MKNETTISQQVKILNSRNLTIPDDKVDEMKLFLSNNNYYKITGYLYKYKIPDSENFSTEISLEKLCHIYAFDESLRILLLKILGIIESSFKTS